MITTHPDVSTVSEVALLGTGTLTITQTGSEALTIEAEDNIMPKIKTSVENNRLTIGFEDATNISPTKPIKYDLSVKDLAAVELAGSGDINLSTLKTDALKASISGSGSLVVGSLSVNSLVVSIPGSGHMAIGGTTPIETIDIPGSGSYNGNRLDCKEAKVTIGGSGTVSLRVSDNLDVTISGSGSVNYLGNPTITKNITGSGHINKIGD